jgi:hypothetical protein
MEDGIERLFRIARNYQATLRNIPEEQRPHFTLRRKPENTRLCYVFANW